MLRHFLPSNAQHLPSPVLKLNYRTLVVKSYDLNNVADAISVKSRSVGNDELIVVSLLHFLHEQRVWVVLLEAALRKKLTKHGARTQQVTSAGLLRPEVHSDKTCSRVSAQRGEDMKN